VSLGLGSVIASAFEVAPWLIAIGRHKIGVFIGVGGLLALNYWLAIVRPRQMNCAPGEVCHVDSRPMRLNRLLFWISVSIFAVAVTVTYVALLWVRMQS
jgi:hypothetical protein